MESRADSRVVAAPVAMDQLEAMDMVKRIDGVMILQEGWGAKQVLKSLLWSRRENLNRSHIYATLVIETSPGNFQAWLKHDQVLDEATSTQVAKELALRFRGDLGSADWRHFGRLVGFTNPKPNRRRESGLQPFVRLIEANGRIYSNDGVHCRSQGSDGGRGDEQNRQRYRDGRAGRSQVAA
ncbi:MAG: DNA-primase RepB domain-containing protein [Candidatus Binataceae bacterium]